ncbi:MAG: sulfatase-like hydrolase/transferase [Verrucomicrobiales bacterium]
MSESPLSALRGYVSIILAFASLSAPLAAEGRPNVLFLAVDDMNDWIGCLGTTPSAITPNIDRLAARGVNFSNAHTAGVFCAPSRAAIFSGQFASTTGCYTTSAYFADHPNIEGLQTSFSKAGYTTLGAGKLFHHPAGNIDQRGWSEFFLRNQSQRENGWPLDSWSAETPFPDPFPASIFNRGQEIKGGLFLEWAAIPDGKEEEMADTQRVNWAVEQLKTKHDKPFFLAAGIYAPHFPNYCPQKYFDLYDPEKIQLPPYKIDDLEDLPERIRRAKTARSRIHQKLEGLDAVKDAIHGYLACMSYADAMMGRVLDALEASPYSDNTIVVLWSDHGYHHGEKGDWGKHTLWERTSNVPFIWAGPGVAKGVRTDVTVSLIDMYPTFVDMCDLPEPRQQLEGTSLAGTLASPATAKDRDVYLPFMAPGEYAVINRDWRYISYGDDGEELYDVGADPNEWHNIAGDLENGAVKERLRKAAPGSFAPASPKRHIKKDLIIEGESFRWRGASDEPEAEQAAEGKGARDKPNIVVILTDDQGYADISFTPDHPREVSTPNMDALAAEGVFFSQAYTSGSVCSPTRAGLMLGQYQQRVGVYTAGDGGRGFDPTIPIFPAFLPDEYSSSAIGKWHLGLDDDFPALKWHAMNRGFTECYKFMGRGGHDYFELKGVKGDDYEPIYRNRDRLGKEEYEGYLTTRLTEEAVDFIGREKDTPFFLYLAYNAVHAPAQAPKEDIERYRKQFPEISEKRAILMAMLEHLDRGVGAVVKKLKDEGEWDNTLLFFLTDNGGAKGMEADNGRLKGYKHSLSEGGIRTPWIVSWPNRFKGGRVLDTPVISIDILPTVMHAIGTPRPEGRRFDGRSLLPILTGNSKKHHDTLFWDDGPDGEWAVRHGAMKVHSTKKGVALYDLSEDPSETTDLSKEKPEAAAELIARHGRWRNHVSASAADRKAKPSSKVAAPNPGKRRRAKAKNILLVVCDDLNTHVSPSGYDPIQTPTFAKFASEGMTFKRAFCQYPVCGPSRASFLNGLYPESSGVLDNRADIRQTRPGTVSMPQFFKENGYWTGSVGKVFHSPRHEHGDLAWDEFQRFENDELPVVVEARKKFEGEHGSVELPKNRRTWRTLAKEVAASLDAQTPPGYGPSGLLDAQHKDGKNVRQVSEWLREEAHGEKPFFIACGIQKPHVPFLAPQKYFDLYPRDQIVYEPDRPDLWDSIPRKALNGRFKEFGFELGKEDDARRREYMQAYHACISFIDAQLGIVFDSLKETGQWDDTIVILTSDHGYHLGDHFMWGKVSLFDIGAKVPFIIRVPGLTQAGSESEAMVELVDIYPTLVDLQGLTPPDHLQGLSMRPLLGHPERKGKKRFAYSVVTRGKELGYALRNQRWRYGKWPDGEELYNLTLDPTEKRNLAGMKNTEARLLEFRRVLAQRQREAASRR